MLNTEENNPSCFENLTYVLSALDSIPDCYDREKNSPCVLSGLNLTNSKPFPDTDNLHNKTTSGKCEYWLTDWKIWHLIPSASQLLTF